MDTTSVNYPPTNHDWERFRDLICTLYTEKKLEEVRHILHTHHRFRASENMFKKRFAAWRVGKNKKTKIQGPGARRGSLSPRQKPGELKSTSCARPAASGDEQDVEMQDDLRDGAFNVDSNSAVMRADSPDEVIPRPINLPEYEWMEKLLFCAGVYTESCPRFDGYTTFPFLGYLSGMMYLDHPHASNAIGWSLINSVCQKSKEKLLESRRDLLCDIFTAFSHPSWPRFPELRTYLLRYLAHMSYAVLGPTHPASSALKCAVGHEEFLSKILPLLINKTFDVYFQHQTSLVHKIEPPEFL